MKKKLSDNVYAEISCFDNGSEVTEYHVMLHVSDGLLNFRDQLTAIDQAYTCLLRDHLQGAKTVFKRYFLSDAYNQANDVVSVELDYADYALSIIQQPPLDGTKVAVWAYLQTHVQTRALHSGLHEVTHGSYRHLWNASAHNLAKNSEYQTRLLLNEYIMQLMQEGCKLSDNCIRTWFFVNDVDNNYPGVVKARNTVFFTQNLTDETHFIASTGIGGFSQTRSESVAIDFAGKSKKTEVIEITNAGHSTLNISSLQMFTPGLRISLGKRQLAPGETTKLKITAMRDDLQKVRTQPRILMITNDPQKPKVTITINAK